MAECVGTPPMALKNAAVTLTATFYDDNGNEADPGVTTIGVVGLDGSAVVAAGTATAGSGTARTYALSGQAQLDVLTVTWTTANFGAFDTQLEIVGAFLFSLRDARATDDGALINQSDYSTADIEAARARITDAFENICGVSFVPRVARVTLDGLHDRILDVPHGRVTTLRSLETRARDTSTWTAYTDDELAQVIIEPWGTLTQETCWRWHRGRQNVRVTYEHGYSRPPGEIQQAALAVLRYTLVPSNLSLRALSEVGTFGSIQMARADSDRGWWYGLPFVDATLNRYSERGPVVA